MKLTRLDRMERVEDILQDRIQDTEKALESLGEMKDAEICRLRIMYLLNLREMRRSLMGLRRRMDLEYAMRRREDQFHDEISNFIEMPGDRHEPEADQQRGKQESAARRRAGDGLRHVRPDDREPAGHDGGKAVRAGSGQMKDWQMDIMWRDASGEPVTLHL